MSFLTENLLGIVVACIIILLIIQLKNTFTYFSSRGLPYLKPNISDILKSVQLSSFNDRPSEYYDKCKVMDLTYVGVHGPFLKPMLLILDPSLVESIMIKDFSYFQDHGLDLDFKENPLAEHLFNMKGDKWRTLRHKLVPTFTSGKLRGMMPIMEECADTLVEEINKQKSLKTDTNLKELFKRYSLAVIASCAFGIDPASIKDPDCQFRRVLDKLVQPSFISRLRLISAFLFPKLAKYLKIKMFDQEIEDFIFNLTKQTMDMRIKSGVKRNDFIQLLLELKEKGSVGLDAKDLEQDEKRELASMEKEPSQTKLELTDGLLAAQVFVFLIAGFENTAYIIAVTQYLIAKHPEIQARVRDEVITCKNKHGEFDYQALRDMTLLGACIDEALRLYPALPLLVREANKPYTFRDGKKIEKGMPVIIPAISYQNDIRFWTNPEEFNPDRFLNGENIKPGTYMPFGDGPRICIAQRMALLETKLIIAKLLLKYQVEPSPKTKEPIKIKIVLGADNEGGFFANFNPLKK